MHIPTAMLNGTVCPITLAVGGLGVAAAGYAARHSAKKPSAIRFAAVTALIFALQMLNFPVQSGTSGHLIGAVLGVSLLGVPFAVLSMAIVLSVQALVFGDGGVAALGANVLNMGIIGAGVAGIILQNLERRNINVNIRIPVAAWLSVMAAALGCSLEVAVSGTAALSKILPAMLSVHALIGIGEAAITLGVLCAFAKVKEQALSLAAFALAALAVIASPLASSYPDGLERVATNLSITSDPAANYTVITALLGVGLIVISSMAAARFCKPSCA